jgi:Rv0078B-related antitoxin
LGFAPHIFPMLPDEQASPEQIAALRAMTGQERLRLAQQLYWSARKMKTAGVRAQHPDWSEAQVEAEVLRIFTHART